MSGRGSGGDVLVSGGGRSLAEVIATRPAPEEALRLATEVARAVAALHAAGRVHGALEPGGIAVEDAGVRLGEPVRAASVAWSGGRATPWLAVPEYTAPEVLRGERPRRAADVFAVGTIAHALVGGASPFTDAERLESVRRVLHEQAPPLAGVAPGVQAAVQQALSKRAWRRPSARRLVEALGGAAARTPPASPASVHAERSASAPADVRSRSAAAPPASPAAVHAERSASAPADVRSRSAAAPLRTPRAHLRPLPLLAGAALLALLAGYALLPEPDAALSSEITTLIRSGELARARTRLDGVARRRPGDPLVEKLRGDVACARGSGTECLRRYRTALAVRPALRENATLRENTRALMGRRSSCAERRTAAELLAELRDTEALPALEEARRNAGFFEYFCTGDAIERAIATTRAAAR